MLANLYHVALDKHDYTQIQILMKALDTQRLPKKKTI